MRLHLRHYCIIGAILAGSGTGVLLIGLTQRNRHPPEPVFAAGT